MSAGDWIPVEPDGTVDFGGIPPRYVDLPAYEMLTVETDDGWEPPGLVDAEEDDGTWIIEDGAEVAGEFDGEASLVSGILKSELSGPPEVVETREGDVRFVIPTGNDVETIKFGEFECQRCESVEYIPQVGEDVQGPVECPGCEREGPFEHRSGTRDDVTGRQLLRLVASPWETPGGVDDDLDGLWDDVREFVYDHWCAHPDDEFMYEGLAAWAMTTWVRPQLRAVAHLIVGGRFGGGKTRLLNTLRRVSYRSATYGSVTESSVFRFIDRLDATPMFTEFHRWEKEQRKDLETLLMLGYNRGEYVQRNEEVAGEWIPQNFDPFTSIGVGTQYSLPDDIKSRSVTIHTAKRHRDVVEEFDERSERRGRNLRNRLLYLRWLLLDSKEWDAAERRASGWLDEHDISDRCKQILKGMTTMAVIFDKLDTFENFALEIRRQVKVAQSESTDAMLIDIVRNMALAEVGQLETGGQQVIGDAWSVAKIYYGDVVNRYNELTGEDRNNSWFGHAVSRFDLDTGRDEGTFIRDDDLKPKLKRLVENAELEWREPQPEDDIDDPRFTVKKHVVDNYDSDQEFSQSEVAGKLADAGLAPDQVGHALTALVQDEFLMRDGDDYWIV